MTHRSITAALACAIVAGSATFVAMPAQAEPTAQVRYADLDLGSEAGRRTLAHRVSSAVSMVCPSRAGDWNAEFDCRRVATSRAHADLAKAGVAAF